MQITPPPKKKKTMTMNQYTVLICKCFCSQVNTKTQHGETGLYWATTCGYKAVKILLEHGASVNHQDYKGEVPIMRALRFDNIAAIKLLLQYGASINIIKNNEGRTLFIMANETKPRISDLLEAAGYEKTVFYWSTEEHQEENLILRDSCRKFLRNYLKCQARIKKTNLFPLVASLPLPEMVKTQLTLGFNINGNGMDGEEKFNSLE